MVISTVVDNGSVVFPPGVMKFFNMLLCAVIVWVAVRMNSLEKLPYTALKFHQTIDSWRWRLQLVIGPMLLLLLRLSIAAKPSLFFFPQ